jgi:phosphate-selective porin OprO/OprP
MVIERLPAVTPIADAPAAEKKPDAVKVEEQKADDGWIDLSTEKWTVKLGGHVQMDYVLWPNHTETIPAQNYFEFRRLRLVADGTGYGVYDFRLQMTLEPETVNESGGTATTPDVKDAYLSMNEIPWIGRARIGNFFVPFSLEQVTNDTNNLFLERSIPANGTFSADREVGVAFYNHSDDLNFTWSYGAFFDNISDTLKEKIDDNQGIRVAGRTTWLSYYDEPSNGRYLFFTGAGILFTDDADNRVRFRSRPEIHEGPRLIDTGILNANTYSTGNVELATVRGPFSVQSEMFAANVNLDQGDQALLTGAYVYTSYFLTGENRIFERFGQHGAQFGRNVPYTNFFLVPGGRGSGAWELKARLAYLDFDEADAGRYNDLTVGFNWYWTERVRVMFDWIHPVTSPETVYGETNSDILGMRFDFNW